MTVQTNKLRNAILRAFAASATLMAGTGAALAQDTQSAPPPADAPLAAEAKAKTLDRIEFTGSRLKRAEIEGTLPITVLDRKAIDASGKVLISDYLRTFNSNAVGQFRPRSSSSIHSGVSTEISGLGSQRNLVLVDGHRQPSVLFSAAGGQDPDCVPLAAVERIEVLADGKLAIYGADAVDDEIMT
ncbi:MAG: TonB-dependent receptor plug domain-containing protein [Luteimonas sp.]|nr:TonB-dependent receptor plug domain-containing protein [Luteimonas sp.]